VSSERVWLLRRFLTVSHWVSNVDWEIKRGFGCYFLVTFFVLAKNSKD
jgi:hypothetical protein